MARTPLTPSQLLDRSVTERELEDYTEECLQRFGWLYHHNNDSRRSHAGLPDLIAVRNGVLLAAELKRETGKPSVVQARWLDALKVAEQVETRLWKPSDMREIFETLR